MGIIEASRNLDYIMPTAAKGELIIRYEGSKHVRGDSVTTHIGTLNMLAALIYPLLLDEFNSSPEKLENIKRKLFVMLSFHDNDEIIAGADIPTIDKVHNADDLDEKDLFRSSLLGLDSRQINFLCDCFSEFRVKSFSDRTLVSKIAKSLDNIAGNMRVIEQKIGVINPDYAAFCIDYVYKCLGTCETVDNLINAQIQQILRLRDSLNNEETLSKIAGELNISTISIGDLVARLQKLLLVDISDNFTYSKAKAKLGVWEID